MLQKVGRYPVLSILVVSGTIGFLIGGFQHGTWQLAVESAQVLAGLVAYSDENPFYMHHTKLWSLLHQLCVPLLVAGVSERILSLLFSGVIGMLFLQALSLTVWAICKDMLLGLAAPLFVLFTHATKYCAIYPVILLGTSNTHGAIGLALLLLILALIGSKRDRTPAFLIGLLPCIHLALGILCWIVILVLFLFAEGKTRRRFAQTTPFFLLGFCITLASLTFHFLSAYDVPRLNTTVGARYVHTFVRNWDSHRMPIQLSSPGLLLNFVAFGLTAICVIRHREVGKTGPYLLIFSLLIASGLGILFTLISHIPINKLPLFLTIMMPARILELNVLAFVPLLFGLFGRLKETLAGSISLMLLTLTGLTFSVLPLSALFIFALIASVLQFIPVQRSIVVARLVRGSALLIVAAMAVWLFLNPNRFRQEPEEWDNFSLALDSVLVEASKDKTLLLTGSDLHLIQLRARRPVLLDGGQLDILPYTYEAGPQMSWILAEVYGVDYFDPPQEARRTARIRVHAHKTLWEKRTLAEWLSLAARFGFTQVLTYGDWKLTLPAVARDEKFVLYQIPQF